jgi:hypothetical protein
MTQWGMLLLCVYIALGVGRFSWRTAGRIALVLTVIVLVAATVSYTHSGPPVPSTNVAGTQVSVAPGVTANPKSTEDTTGRAQELANTPQAAGNTSQNQAGKGSGGGS